jgi:hypothetical protein
LFVAFGVAASAELALAQTGACCFPGGKCEITTEVGCDRPGLYQGDATTCEPNLCPQPVNRVSASEKGSLLMYSKVELR